jgi:hypothetical protein
LYLAFQHLTKTKSLEISKAMPNMEKRFEVKLGVHKKKKENLFILWYSITIIDYYKIWVNTCQLDAAPQRIKTNRNILCEQMR